MCRLRFSIIVFAGLLGATAIFAKDPPPQVIVWPSSGAPIIRFTFGKFKGIGSAGSQHNYTVETKVENLWDKPISEAHFSLYLFDKNRVRIGEGWIAISNSVPGQSIQFETTVQTSGLPVSMSIAPRSLPPELSSYLPAKKVSVTVNSVPQGADIKVDGVDAGSTPKRVEVRVGKHLVEFTKTGFNPGKFPLEIGPDDVSGGSISYELGVSAHDTLEMRDGSVLTGDVESMSSTDVVVRIAGGMQTLSRNQIKRITLVQREPNSQ